MQCNECGSRKIVKSGTQMSKKRGRLQRYQCKDCGHFMFRPLKVDDE